MNYHFITHHLDMSHVLHNYFAQQKPILVPKHDFSKGMFSNFLNNREHELAEAVHLSDRMKNEHQIFINIKRSLSSLLNVETKDIHFYGSRVMGLANEGSDLDIYIDIEGSYHTGLAKEKQQLYLEKFKHQLEPSTDWDVGIALRDATVPILYLVYIPKNIKCKTFLFIPFIFIEIARLFPQARLLFAMEWESKHPN